MEAQFHQLDEEDQHNFEQSEDYNPFLMHEMSHSQDHMADKQQSEEHKASFLFMDPEEADNNMSEDEDEALFNNIAKDKAMVTIQESIDELIEKGKKRTLSYKELLQRREARKKRLMQADEARCMILMQIARVISVNRVVWNQSIRGWLMSVVSEQYWVRVKELERIGDKLKMIVQQFTGMFIGRLDDSVECIQTLSNNLFTRLTTNKALSKLDYLLLFGSFITLHQDLIFRNSFIVDLSLIENSSPKYPQQGKKGGGQKLVHKNDQELGESIFGKDIEKSDDKYQYGLAKQANKKRKYQDIFSQKKQMLNEDNNHQEEHQNDREFKKFRHNPESQKSNSNNSSSDDTQKKQQESDHLINLLDKFAFHPVGKRTQLRPVSQQQTQAQSQQLKGGKSQKTQESEQSFKVPLPQSHLHLSSDKVLPESHSSQFKPKSDAQRVHSTDSVDSTRDTILTFSENMFIEIYDIHNHRWLIACPFTNRVISSNNNDVRKYFRNEGTLYVLSGQNYSSQEDGRGLFIRDIGVMHVNERDINHYLKAKNQCILTRTVDDNITLFGQYFPFLADPHIQRLVKQEQAEIERLEMRFVPSTMNEFKNNKYYTLVSTLRKYQGLLPTAQPVPDQTFKSEPIYKKSDVTELHTPERWRKHQRQVKLAEIPYKRVKGLYNDADRMAELYGFWQTIPYRLTLTQDGKIPANQYGNIEVFNGPLPEGTVHVDLPKAALICRKLKLEHVPAVVGFEKGGGGRSHPCVSGVVTFAQNRKLIEQELINFESKAKEREQEKVEKRAKQVWKMLLKTILVKKYIRETYDHGEVPF